MFNLFNKLNPFDTDNFSGDDNINKMWKRAYRLAYTPVGNLFNEPKDIFTNKQITEIKDIIKDIHDMYPTQINRLFWSIKMRAVYLRCFQRLNDLKSSLV